MRAIFFTDEEIAALEGAAISTMTRSSEIDPALKFAYMKILQEIHAIKLDEKMKEPK